MARRKIPEINAGSMADIAFLLLIFFLVTTTMEAQTGIFRKLPPMEDQEEKPPKVKKRNLFNVLVNQFNQIQINGEEVRVENITKKTREFIENKMNDEKMSEKKTISIDGFGEVEISKGIVSLQNDRGTSYETYIAVQDALAIAFRQMRNDKARATFGKSYDELVKNTDEDKIKVIKKMVPMSVSEAEPKNIK